MLHWIAKLSLLICTCCLTASAFAGYVLNMPYGVSPISHKIYDLHMAAFYICCVIGILVFAVITYSLIRFRKSKGVKAAHFHEHLWIEIIWTTIPFLILIALAIPATRVLADIHNTDESALTIKITGYQWKWKYEYLDNGVKFFSFLSTPQDQIVSSSPKNKWFLAEVDQPMVVPVNTKVKLLVTSDDVIHAWWVPELGVKQDAIPGFINENWFYITKPGEYRGACGELCGINHGFMPIVVKAVSLAEFNQWVMQRQKSSAVEMKEDNVATLSEAALLTLGKKEYERNCAMCHLNDGAGLGSSFPALIKSPVVVAPLDETIAYVLHGIPGTPMQAFGHILNDKTLAAIVTYIRQAWGNGAVNQRRQQAIVAQPVDVKRIRQQLGTV